MKITVFLQVRNEMQSGNLSRFLTWNSPLWDYLAVYDDFSTDNTADMLRNRADVFVQGSYRAFKSELTSKSILLEKVKADLPDTDWILWLDADELLLTSRSELERLIESAELSNFDGISLHLTNLWKSEYYFRTDSGFDNLTNIRLWKNSKDLKFPSKPGLHLLMQPEGLTNVYENRDFDILHFGFASRESILKKFCTYRDLGQRGNALWRLINEKDLDLSDIFEREERFGQRFHEYFSKDHKGSQPIREGIYDYYWDSLGDSGQIGNRKPKITLISLIFSGVDWLEFQYGELLRLAGEFEPGEVEILFVSNDATSNVLDFLEKNNIPYVIAPGKSHPGEWYINSVYRGYNFGVAQASGDWVLLTNSDMAYAQGFLRSLFDRAQKNKYVVAKLIESGRLTPAKAAIRLNLGKTLSSFRRKRFLRVADRIKMDTEIDSGLYMPAMINREVFLDLGGYPEGNIHVDSLISYIGGENPVIAKLGESLIPGDAAFIQRAKENGVEHVTYQGAITYHFQEGEISSKHSGNPKHGSGIAIANDMLIGINGEETLWNYLLADTQRDGILNAGYELGVNRKLPYRLKFRPLYKRVTKPRLLFRNATFLNNISGPWKQVVLVQDQVSAKSILRKQRKSRTRASAEVTNSDFFITDVVDPKVHKYLLPLPINSIWETTPRIEKPKSDRLTFAFVGAFSDTKGWPEVLHIIDSNPDCDFVAVSKYSSDDPAIPTRIKNVRILRKLSGLELIALLDQCDGLIIGSNFETQCLAAIEAASRDVPLCMKPTGLLATLNENDRRRVGEFDLSLETAFRKFKANLNGNRQFYNPKNMLLEYGLTSVQLRESWVNMLKNELMQSFVSEQKSLRGKVSDKLPSKLKFILKLLIRNFT